MDAELERRVAAAARILRQGGIVAYPTETFYGLGALATCRPALERLATSKLRAPGKPLPLLADDREQLEGAVVLFDALADRLAARFWPGPLTLVLPAAPGLLPEIHCGTGTAGVRVPGSEVARLLAREAGGAIVSTSANLSGGPPVTDAALLDPVLVARVDAVLDGGHTPGGLASTVVAVGPQGVRLLRTGAVPWSEIEQAVEAATPSAACTRSGP